MKYSEEHIKNFEIYTINTRGEVFNTITKRYKKPQKYKNGYLFVSLYQDGRNKMFLIHRLVAEAFIPNPEGKPQVGHWDCNRSNNAVENLYWCTATENMNNPITRKNISKGRKGIKPSEETRKKMSEAGSKRVGKLNGFYRRKHTDEFKEKASERMKKKLSSDPQYNECLSKARILGRSKQFKTRDQISPIDGEVIKTWDNYLEFSQSGYSSECVRRCCQGKRNTYKKFMWRYWK